MQDTERGFSTTESINAHTSAAWLSQSNKTTDFVATEALFLPVQIVRRPTAGEHILLATMQRKLLS